MLKVGIDISPLQTGHSVRGIGIYTKNLLDAFEKIVLEENDIQIKALDFKFQIKNFKLKIDLIHYPYFDLFFNTLPLGKPVSTIVTVHDVIPLIFPEQYPPGLKGQFNYFLQKHSLRSVKAIITDSFCSKKDIARHLDYPEEKIYVVYLAPSQRMKVIRGNEWKKRIRERYKLPEKFVLYVGDVNWNKNIVGLAKACTEIGIPLVIVGKQAAENDFDREHIENQPRLRLLEECAHNDNILRIGFVEEEDLVKIYNLAQVYCHPSFYEGFGLPILEAMSCGCPVVSSNKSSLPEVCGDAALLVDPYDIRGLSTAIKKVLQNNKTRSELINKGLKQAKLFSWEKTASETLKVYEKVVN